MSKLTPRLLLAGFVATLIAFTFVAATPIYSQTPTPITIPVALAPVQRDTLIELIALTLDADITESGGHTLLTGNSTFRLHNTDKLNQLQAPMGFPAWAGDTFAFDPTRLSSFSASVDGKKTTLTPSRADVKIGSVVRAVDWYTFTLSLAPDEKKTVRFDFQQDLGESALPRFSYGMLTATAWKGSVGSTRLTIRFPDSTTPEQIVAYDPPNTTFDGQELTWRFTGREPVANPTMTFLRPSLWADLLNRRRAVQQNQNDANAHAALGNLFRQLASIDSPRRDSYLSQAIAELETAARLDPNQRGARQALGALYESRAGPATGPRQTAYVQLAVAQWETLATTDAVARKQLAEDYFYLALDDQTRGEYADALAYFDKAATLAPNGAGPLFTSERAAAQRRVLNIAWARTLLEKDDYSSAADKARAALGDAFVKSFTPPPFYTTRTQITMAANTRTMVFRLAPFATRPAELQNTLNGIAAALSDVGDVNVTNDNSDAILTIQVSFADQEDLKDKLSALAKALPDRPEWALLRAIMSPKALDWDVPGGLITNSTNYREEVDLTRACSTVEAQLQTIGQIVKPLENAPATDAEGQLKRSLLKNAQSGWQRVLAQGRVTYRAGANEVSVDACAARTVAVSASPMRVEFIGLIIAGVGLFAMGLLFVVWRRYTSRQVDT